jgi:hypothetical protein
MEVYTAVARCDEQRGELKLITLFVTLISKVLLTSRESESSPFFLAVEADDASKVVITDTHSFRAGGGDAGASGVVAAADSMVMVGFLMSLDEPPCSFYYSSLL